MRHDPARLDIEPHRTALVLLDLQNYNVHPDGYWMSQMPEGVERMRPSIARTVDVLEAARAAGIAVIHVANQWRDGHPDINPYTPWMAQAKEAGRSTEGTWGVEFFEPVAPRDEEFVVRKRAVSAFAGTELDRLLRSGVSSDHPRGLLRDRVRRVAGLLDDTDPPGDRRGRDHIRVHSGASPYTLRAPPSGVGHNSRVRTWWASGDRW